MALKRPWQACRLPALNMQRRAAAGREGRSPAPAGASRQRRQPSRSSHHEDRHLSLDTHPKLGPSGGETEQDREVMTQHKENQVFSFWLGPPGPAPPRQTPAIGGGALEAGRAGVRSGSAAVGVLARRCLPPERRIREPGWREGSHPTEKSGSGGLRCPCRQRGVGLNTCAPPGGLEFGTCQPEGAHVTSCSPHPGHRVPRELSGAQHFTGMPCSGTGGTERVLCNSTGRGPWGPGSGVSGPRPTHLLVLYWILCLNKSILGRTARPFLGIQ